MLMENSLKEAIWLAINRPTEAKAALFSLKQEQFLQQSTDSIFYSLL